MKKLIRRRVQYFDQLKREKIKKSLKTSEGVL